MQIHLSKSQIGLLVAGVIISGLTAFSAASRGGLVSLDSHGLLAEVIGSGYQKAGQVTFWKDGSTLTGSSYLTFIPGGPLRIVNGGLKLVNTGSKFPVCRTAADVGTLWFSSQRNSDGTYTDFLEICARENSQFPGWLNIQPHKHEQPDGGSGEGQL